MRAALILGYYFLTKLLCHAAVINSPYRHHHHQQKQHLHNHHQQQHHLHNLHNHHYLHHHQQQQQQLTVGHVHHVPTNSSTSPSPLPSIISSTPPVIDSSALLSHCNTSGHCNSRHTPARHDQDSGSKSQENISGAPVSNLSNIPTTRNSTINRPTQQSSRQAAMSTMESKSIIYRPTQYPSVLSGPKREVLVDHNLITFFDASYLN